MERWRGGEVDRGAVRKVEFVWVWVVECVGIRQKDFENFFELALTDSIN